MKFLASSEKFLVCAAVVTAVALSSSLAAADIVEVTSEDMSIGFGNGCTLPEAIEAVNNGSNFFGCNFEDDGFNFVAILLPDGDYEASAPLTLTADVEVFASTAAVLHTGSEWGLAITGDGNGGPRVVLNGLSVRGADAPLTSIAGIYVSAGATLVARNVTVTHCNGAGILVDGGSLEMDNSHLSENGVGLSVSNGDASLLANSINGNAGNGVFVDASTVEVRETFLNINGENGVEVTGTGRLLVTRSNLAGNAGNGAALVNETEFNAGTDEEQFIAEGCLFQGNQGSGFFNASGAARLEGCHLSGNSNSGLRNDVPIDSLAGNSETRCNDCIIRDNFADFGGGIWNGIGSGCKIFIVRSAVIDNVAFNDGGGVFNRGQPTFSNTTFSGNFAFRDGGGLHITGNELTLWHTTIMDNQALGRAGGLYANASQPRIFFSIIAGNTAFLEPDVDGNSLNGFFSVVGEPFDAGDWNPPDVSQEMQFGVDPLLGPLQNVDGVTWAHPPLPGSPVLDKIPAQQCQTSPAGDPLLDQRGLGRPVGTGCDSGAIEQGQPGTLPRIEALNWTSSAPLSLNSQRRTEGSFGLNVGGSGYRVVNSAVFRGVPRVSSSVRLDFFVPKNPPNPYWLGAVQMFATCASANIYNMYLGQQELTGLPLGKFSTLSFNVPNALKLALAQQGGCFLSIAVNTNATPTAPVLDNLRIASP